MQQWHKLYMCLGQVKRQEIINECQYEYILSYELISIWSSLKYPSRSDECERKIICSSDKIFGGHAIP